jgi:hypothetical protein
MSQARLAGTLLLTHSSRTTNLERCSPQFLTRRFDARRLRDLPPVETLRPAPTLYSGAVSFLRVGGTEAEPTFTPAGAFRHPEKIQHALFLQPGPDGRRLLVAFEHRLEIWKVAGTSFQPALEQTAGTSLELRLEHPHLAGVHTVDLLPGPEERVLVSCAAADALMIANLTTGRVEGALRLPGALYGSGYPLSTGHDLRHRYIPDRYQTTHVNSASLIGGDQAVYSTLIQGAIGLCDLRTGTFREITRGFVGCHGARANGAGTLYFTDSATGSLIFLDGEGRITYRHAIHSRWLHDTLSLTERLWAFALADRNELRIYDLNDERLLHRQRFPLRETLPRGDEEGWLGDSVQALAWCPA